MAHICILSRMEIPSGEFSREHYLPKSQVPYRIAQRPSNIFPAIKVFNFIKGNKFPCEWEDQKYAMIQQAYDNWHLSKNHRNLLRMALKNGIKPINPCEYCLASKFTEYCILRPAVGNMR